MSEIMNEERYQFVLSLYLIRTQYPQMGLFQPDFIWVIFRGMMPSKYNRSDADIQEAVNKWCKNPVAAEVKYGHISKWNTSLVTNMMELFYYKRKFNDDISKWNVSSVTNMESMFWGAPFDGDISGWNVSSVTDMSYMFCHTPFDGDISGWNVSSVTNMSGMFYDSSFGGDISGWNVSSVKNMGSMFEDCPIPEAFKPSFG
jgi:surface protein